MGEDATDQIERIVAHRPPVAGLRLDRPRLMGIVNVTPDSFSDGGRHATAEAAIAHALQLVDEGADILDIGGESTRPGAEPVSVGQECDRVLPVIAGVREAGCAAPVSIDTRNAETARAALAAGARLINDVSAMTHDPGMPEAASGAEAVCLMHAQGDPRTMQQAPRYGDVLLDILAYLEERVGAAEAAGLHRAGLIVDPGIGFGKTEAHNLALLARLSAFHTLGCPILLGASRKRFIGRITGVAAASERVSGSVAVALMAADQGAHILRVHDVAATRAALQMRAAIRAAASEERAP